MTSNPSTAYVWLWLPGDTDPVLCGRLVAEQQRHVFTYSPAYLQRNDAIALDPVELPLQPGELPSNDDIHRAIRDAAPDSWGRRVILYQQQLPPLPVPFSSQELTEIDFLCFSDANRIGALHFQRNSGIYQAGSVPDATLEQLQQVAEKVEMGEAIPAALHAALLHGTSIGGARPKAFLTDHAGKQFIAKFSSTTDFFSLVKAEFAAMQLAKKVGLHVAETHLLNILGKDVLLVERFDREVADGNTFLHRFMSSGLTALQLHETGARYASYLDLADFIRKYSKQPASDLVELYRRMVFNILIGNTDDHARNHAFFWDGAHYQLTPAYDICPMLRLGYSASQAMIVGKNGAQSTLANALSCCDRFNLDVLQADKLNQELVAQIKLHWPAMCERAQISAYEQERLQKQTVLAEYCFQQL